MFPKQFLKHPIKKILVIGRLKKIFRAVGRWVDPPHGGDHVDSITVAPPGKICLHFSILPIDIKVHHFLISLSTDPQPTNDILYRNDDLP